MIGDLMAFVRARLDEEAQVALRATSGPWRWIDPGGKVKSALVGPGHPYQTVIPAAGGDVYPSKYDAAHIVWQDPAHVLRRLESDRRILDRYADQHYHAPAFPGSQYPELRAEETGACRTCVTLRLMALRYADHPDYREDWHPETEPNRITILRRLLDAYATEPPPLFRGPGLSERGEGYNAGMRDLARAALDILDGHTD